MRVAIVTESFLPSINGVTRAVTALTGYLRRTGHDAMVVAPAHDGEHIRDPSDDDPGQETHDGFPVVRVPGIAGLVYPDLTVAPVDLRLWRRLREFRADVVHLASPACLGVFGGLTARSLGVPTAAHYQTDLVAYARSYAGAPAALMVGHMERTFYNGCTVTYAPTDAVAAALRERGFERVSVSGRGVDTQRFRPRRPGAAGAVRRWPSGTGPRLLCVCRLAREKNLHRLLSVAAGWPRSRLLLVGDGPCRDELALSAPHNVAFSGALEGDDLADAYAAADLFVYPSLTETFGQVVQEAMAAALPIVAVRAGGVADLVRHGRTGMLVDPPGDGLGAAASLLASSLDRRRAFGAAARRAVLPRSWDAIFDTLLGDYARLADRRNEAPPDGIAGFVNRVSAFGRPAIAR